MVMVVMVEGDGSSAAAVEAEVENNYHHLLNLKIDYFFAAAALTAWATQDRDN